MYLRASEYVYRHNFNRQTDEDTINPIFNEIVKNLELEDVIDSSGFAGITVDVPMGYWRKSNMIHHWFVNNLAEGVDECQPIYVRREDLEQLKETCIEVIANPESAEELLPTGSGFFFGSTDYDEYYFGDLNDTIGIITRCLESKFDYFEYQASCVPRPQLTTLFGHPCRLRHRRFRRSFQKRNIAFSSFFVISSHKEFSFQSK